MTECNCVNEETEACSFNEHNKCDEQTIPHMCMCMCHYMNVGDRFFTKGQSFVKVSENNIVLVIH